MPTRYASVLGLGFGDCGKGRFVDELTRRWQAHTVVRFNGGAQAGHNVVAPIGSSNSGPTVHHTFSQFGAGTLVPGTRTVLLDPVVVHPTALLVEAQALSRIGVHDALSRIAIDGQCRITTPYHQAAGCLRERLRGEAAHGTCGVGVGETVRHSLDHPDQALRYADLSPALPAKAAMDKLQTIRQTLLAEFLRLCPAGSPGALTQEFQILQDESLATPWLNTARALARQCPPAGSDALHTQLTQPGTVLFEGAQGILLDEWHGFHPHTTWSSITTAAVESAAARVGITSTPFEHYGVLRTYLTRHGTGPLPTHDPALDAQLPEPHNQSQGWQGPFRRAHPDAVLLRYALEAIGPLSGLLVSHLDVFDRGITLKWCESYSAESPPSSSIERLPICNDQDLAHQSTLTNVLMSARPTYASELIDSAPAFLARLASVSSLPLILHSQGPSFADIRET